MPVPKVAASDLVNEPNGADVLVQSLGGDRESTLATMLISPNARIAKSGPMDSTVMAAATDAITNGPWNDRQQTALLALLESDGAVLPKAEAKAA